MVARDGVDNCHYSGTAPTHSALITLSPYNDSQCPSSTSAATAQINLWLKPVELSFSQAFNYRLQ